MPEFDLSPDTAQVFSRAMVVMYRYGTAALDASLESRFGPRISQELTNLQQAANHYTNVTEDSMPVNVRRLERMDDKVENSYRHLKTPVIQFSLLSTRIGNVVADALHIYDDYSDPYCQTTSIVRFNQAGNFGDLSPTEEPPAETLFSLHERFHFARTLAPDDIPQINPVYSPLRRIAVPNLRLIRFEPDSSDQ